MSDRFELRRRNLSNWARDPESEYYVGEEEAEYIVDDRDAYDEANVFWVPAEAGWAHIRGNAKSPRKTTVGIPLITAKIVKGVRFVLQASSLLRKIMHLGCGGDFRKSAMSLG